MARDHLILPLYFIEDKTKAGGHTELRKPQTELEPQTRVMLPLEMRRKKKSQGQIFTFIFF